MYHQSATMPTGVVVLQIIFEVFGPAINLLRVFPDILLNTANQTAIFDDLIVSW